MLKQIEIAENYYVNEEGEVYNKTGKKKSQYINRCGYPTVELFKNNKAKRYTVHRLVALAFIPNPENKPQVNHIDGNKKNNHVSNLEWVTNQENVIHAIQTGLLIRAQGEDVHNAILTNEQVHEICSLMQDGLRNIDIVEKTNVPMILLKNIRRKNSWTHISTQYNIPNKSRTVSEDTVRWICEMLVEGHRNRDILEMSTNPKVNKDLINDIKLGRRYLEISKEYNF